MRVLITGGAGFIGSHLAGELLSRGMEVTCLDNCSTGSRGNLAGYAGRSGFNFIETDGQLPGVIELLTGACDAVVHLAAAVGVQKIIDEPVKTLETNVGFTQAVLSAASRRKLRTLIASSSEVYGRSANDLFRESDDLLIGPPESRRWGYAASKLVDALALAHHHEFGTPVTVMRLFNTVGTRQTGRYGMVVPRFVESALRGEALTVYGTGEQRRTFTDVRESVRAMAELLGCKASSGEVVNIGGAAEVSMNELAAAVIAMTNSRSETRHIAYAEAYGEHFEDMQRRNPDTSKLKRLLGWAPSAGLAEILGPVIAERRGTLSGAA